MHETASKLHLHPGTAADDGDRVVVTPESAGWRFCGLRVVRLAAGEARELVTEGEELAVLPLAGSVVVEVEGRRFALEGRESVFARVSDWAYVPLDAEVRLVSAGGAELALATSRADRRFEPAYVPAATVPVEIRGAGPAVDRLIAVEVLTPDGNWSSYPPHKHDDTTGSLANNEEIYYFRLGKVGAVETSDEGFAVHRTYTADGAIDETVIVRDEDVFLVPRGYHGPSVAAPGYPLYYLNVMAGPNPKRTMATVDDAPYAWIRDSWDGMPTDPRCPMTTASGPR